MGDSIITSMKELAIMLHWFGKHQEGKAVNLLVRFLQLKGISLLDEFEMYINQKENVVEVD